MISDVLFEAIEEIERYETEFPKVYEGLTELAEVKAAMSKLQRKLDTPPSVSEMGRAIARKGIIDEEFSALATLAVEAAFSVEAVRALGRARNAWVLGGREV